MVVKSLGTIDVGVEFKADALVALAVEIKACVIDTEILLSSAISRLIRALNRVVTRSNASSNRHIRVVTPREPVSTAT